MSYDYITDPGIRRASGLPPLRAVEADEAPALALVPISQVDTTPPEFVVPPVMTDDEGMTIWFGDGGAGKTSMAAVAAVTLATDRRVGLIRVGAIRPVIIIPKEAPRGFARRIAGLVDGTDAPIFYPPDALMVLPLWQLVPKVAEVARAELAVHGACEAILVADSLSFGLDDKSVNDPEVPGLMAAATARARLPLLATAHQTKAGDTTKPFGSAHWHNGSRMTWHTGELNGLVTMTCRKSNEFDLVGEVRGYHLRWSDAGLLVGVDALEVKVSTAARIVDVMLGEKRPLTVPQLVTFGCGQPAAIRQAIHRTPERFMPRDGAWELRR